MNFLKDRLPNKFTSSLQAFANNTSKKLTPGLKTLSTGAKNAFEQIKSKIESELSLKPKEDDWKNNIIEIIPRIYHMPFPSPDKIQLLSFFLNDNYKENYWIWNIGEHKYDSGLFKNQVSEVGTPGYPCPGLNQLFIISKSIISWLNSDPKNVAFIHCQSNSGRSALLISCLLCLTQNFHHPGEALLHFCTKTNTDENKILFPTQKLYLKYFSNIQDGIKINNRRVKLLKIVLSSVPKVSLGDLDGKKVESFRPYLQIFKDSKILFNSYQNHVVSYYETDLSIWFDINSNVSEDILIRCKHYHSQTTRVPVFRLMINTDFIFDNVTRFYKKEIDLSPHISVPEDFFIDVFYEAAEEIANAEKEIDMLVHSCNIKMDDVNDTSSKMKNKEKEESKLQDERIETILKTNLSDTLQQSQSNTGKFNIIDNLEAEKERNELEEEIEKSLEEKARQEEILKKIIKEKAPQEGVTPDDHDDELEEDIDDYISKLEQTN